MNIKEIIFDVSVTKTYQIIMSAEQGYDMPKTAKELIDTVNTIHCQPYDHLEVHSALPIDKTVEITYYDIKE